ncbi:MAG: cysteine synthase family protein [Candidatus Vogelbacteria bacterium]|nr:cysteine synthase family protein [Candidatus Vogelbacteria bacterium]
MTINWSRLNAGSLKKIGRTPLVRIGQILAKLESANPTGSIKDRIALAMIAGAEQEGKLRPGDTIIEPTSGNTGIALAFIAMVKHYHLTVVMPEHMSEERKTIIRRLGGALVLTPRSLGFPEAVRLARQLARRPHCFMPNQFANPHNLKAQEATGREILAARPETEIDAVVAGVGTGGTLMGIARAIKERCPKAKVFAVEPAEAPIISQGRRATVNEHQIQGIGDGFIPDLLDLKQVDDCLTVGSQEAIARARRLQEENGLDVGVSSGANIAAAERLAKHFRTIVTVLPDGGEKYRSLGL